MEDRGCLTNKNKLYTHEMPAKGAYINRTMYIWHTIRPKKTIKYL
jgi:hypothetical protein